MDARWQDGGEWEEVQPLGRRELDRILAGHVTRSERRRLFGILDRCGLCIFEK